MSAASASAKPPPIAWPSAAAMTGTGQPSSARGNVMSDGSPSPRTNFSRASSVAPQENVSPILSSTTTFVSADRPTASNASVIECTIVSPSALDVDGSSSVIVAIPLASIDVVTSGRISSMATLPARTRRRVHARQTSVP